MRFPDPLIPGRLVRRYKRFLADVELADGETVTAHCANPGAMLGLTEPGSEVWLSPARNPARKFRHTWELIRADGTLVGINTAHPNAVAAEAIRDGRVPALAGYAQLRREVRYGRNSRIDILLEGGDRPPAHVEVKNVHLRRAEGLAEFPDSITKRGAKHLVELMDAQAHRGAPSGPTRRDRREQPQRPPMVLGHPRRPETAVTARYDGRATAGRALPAFACARRLPLLGAIGAPGRPGRLPLVRADRRPGRPGRPAPASAAPPTWRARRER